MYFSISAIYVSSSHHHVYNHKQTQFFLSVSKVSSLESNSFPQLVVAFVIIIIICLSFPYPHSLTSHGHDGFLSLSRLAPKLVVRVTVSMSPCLMDGHVNMSVLLSSMELQHAAAHSYSLAATMWRVLLMVEVVGEAAKQSKSIRSFSSHADA